MAKERGKKVIKCMNKKVHPLADDEEIFIDPPSPTSFGETLLRPRWRRTWKALNACLDPQRAARVFTEAITNSLGVAVTFEEEAVVRDDSTHTSRTDYSRSGEKRGRRTTQESIKN